MKSTIAGVAAFLLSIFGGHQAVATHPASQPASATVAVASATSATASANTSTGAAMAPITIGSQPVIERIIERAMPPALSAVTETEFDTRLQQLDNKFSSELAAATAAFSASYAPLPAFAQSQRIDQLSNVTITNANLTASEIPDLSGTYLPLTGGTVTGNLTVSGTLTGTASSTNLLAMNATSTNFFATTASSTNLFAQSASLGSLLLTSPLATASGGTGVSIPSVSGFPVEAYGAVGDGSSDDSGAIQSAINAACNAHGGRVVFGARYYKISSTLAINCNNVTLQGQGAGGPISPANPSAYTGANHLGATVLIWAGATNGTMIDFEPSNGALYNVKGGGVNNMVLACYGIGGTGLELLSTNGLDFPNLTVENCTQNYVYLGITQNTLTGGTPTDTQQNHFGNLNLISDWNMPAVVYANGVYLDGNQVANASFNVFDNIYGHVENGVLVDFANSDTNTIYTVRGFQPNGYAGNTIEFHASTTASGAARDNTIYYVQELNHGNVQADANGAGSSYHNQILSLNNGNGGGATPIIQSGASLTYTTSAGSMGTTTVNGGLGINISASSVNNALAVQSSANLSNDGIFLQSPNLQNFYMRPSSGGGSSNPIVQSGDHSLIFSNNSIDTGNFVIAPWASAASGIRIVGSSGFVGIGTSSPAATLSTAGNEYTTGGLGVGLLNTTAGTIQSSGNILGGGTLALSGTTGTSTIASGQGFTIGGSQFVLQQGSGNVGIGLSSPLSRFHVMSSANLSADGLEIQSPNQQNISIRPSTATGGANPLVQAGDLSMIFTNNSVNTGNLVIGPWANTNAGMRMTNTGQIGIGTTTPGSLLSVAGDTYLTGGLGVGLQNTSAGTLQTTGNGTVGGILAVNGTSGTTTIASGQGFTIGGSQFVVQQGSGNVGIGTSTPLTKFQVYGNTILGDIYSTPLNTTAEVSRNHASGATTFGIDNSGDSWYKFTANNGLLKLDTSIATNVLNIVAASGNVGIATTTPWRTLSVTGTVGFDGLTGAFGAGSLCLTANKEVVYNSGSDSCLSSLRSTKHDIQALNLSALTMVKSLQPVSFVYNNDASSTVRYGFIAEDTAAVDSHLATYDQSGAISGVDDRALLAIVVEALQSLINTVGNFADSFTTKELTFTRASGDDISVNTVHSKQLCAQRSDGAEVCVTGDQLAAALAGQAQASAEPSSSGSTPTPDTAPPTITIQGDNPAHVQVGASYVDLGATVTDNVDHNLGYQTYLNGLLVSNIIVDTSAVATDTIDYVANDSAGNTATSTRTVIIEAPTTP